MGRQPRIPPAAPFACARRSSDREYAHRQCRGFNAATLRDRYPLLRGHPRRKSTTTWMRLAASTDRVPSSLLPSRDESSEEEDERGDHEPGKQSVIDPGHL